MWKVLGFDCNKMEGCLSTEGREQNVLSCPPPLNITQFFALFSSMMKPVFFISHYFKIDKIICKKAVFEHSVPLNPCWIIPKLLDVLFTFKQSVTAPVFSCFSWPWYFIECLQFWLSSIFSWLYWGYGFWGRRPPRWGAPLSASYQRSMIWTRFSVGHDVDLDLLVKVMSVSFPHCKVTFFPFYTLFYWNIEGSIIVWIGNVSNTAPSSKPS